MICVTIYAFGRRAAVGQPSHRWCQWISTAQYLYVRSLYNGIDLQQKLPRDRKIPVDQKSGYCHWRCYRSVLKDRIEYWYDTFPEGDSVIREEFFVQREGSFQSPAAEVVCDYADHYRANTGAGSGTFAGK